MIDKKNDINEVSEDSFSSAVLEESAKKLILVDFWAPWCGPCKQLTPILEKIVNSSEGKISLAKINVDENKQIAAQLRIQSIPAVFLFKDKQIVDAFQGMVPEKKIIEMIEKHLGERLHEDLSEFYFEVEAQLKDKNFDNAKNLLEEIIANKPKEYKAIAMYLSCLSSLSLFKEARSFKESLNEEAMKNSNIQSAIKKLEITEKNNKGPSLEILLERLKNNKDSINLILEIADKYFTNNDFEKSFELLLKTYPKNKEKTKQKMVEFFTALGQNNETTIKYRKKLSQILFS